MLSQIKGGRDLRNDTPAHTHLKYAHECMHRYTQCEPLWNGMGWKDVIHICVLHLLSPMASVDSASLPGQAKV